MPELPEVETIRQDLSEKIIGKKITGVTVTKPRLVKSGLNNFIQILTGNTFKKINRRGKLVYVELKKSDLVLLIHLKMTGQLIYQKGPRRQGGVSKIIAAGGHSFKSMEWDLPNKYSHIYFSFQDNSRLFFNDLRTFGYMKLVDEKELKQVLNKFGIEPLTPDFTLKNFAQALKHRKTNIKALLLNQQIIAGIGNIYADEICHYAGVLPSRRTPDLTIAEIKKLWQGSSLILKKAIKERGTTFNNYRDADGKKGNFIKFLKVFGRKGEACGKCGEKIKKIRLAGRGTHFCEMCQH
ncbi:MAG: bifunctional DNA-formamidopyrimidine glycosylase/DNA-(apurinic or apyrimidinic site) lyase [bacterium]|nr:bifunctional DNA-formamidopyrimidine glycosylase/DNA-(apurinic or apyrimidinic site) lyase [bacterium]